MINYKEYNYISKRWKAQNGNVKWKFLFISDSTWDER